MNSEKTEEWGRNGRVNRTVGAGFPRPDWSNRRNRRANRARRAVWEWGERCEARRVVRKLESRSRTEERCANLRVVLELKSGAKLVE